MCRVYISGALTAISSEDGREKLKNFYKRISETCENQEFQAYLPQVHTDPILYPKYTPSEVYEKNSFQIRKSQLLIAYVGEPSLGVGSELELANQNKIPIILLYEDGKRVSRHVRGIPSVLKEIRFTSVEDCVYELSQYLNDLKNQTICKGEK
jgi:nucleoside 2-deoxyribosyltransferase